MKKLLLLLTILCVFPFIGQAQVRSTEAVGSTSEVQEIEQLKSSKKAATELTFLEVVGTNSEAYSVNPSKGDDSEAIICFYNALYKFNLNNPAGATSYGTMAPKYVNSAVYCNGFYYLASSEPDGMLIQVDPETGALTEIASTAPYGSIALAPDGQVYGISLGENSVLYTVDITTGAGEAYANINVSNYLLGFTIDNSGRMFAIDGEIDGISEFNLQTGELISSVAVGFQINGGQDITVDYETNTLYWSAYNASEYRPQLYKVNYDESTFDLIGNFSIQAAGFAIKTVVNQNLPMAPENLVVTPDAGDELLAELSWTNPSTTMSGEDLTDLTVILTRNDEVIEEFASAEIGANMTYTDSNIPAAGLYRYTVHTVNAEGEGGIATSLVMVGPSCEYTVNCYDTYGDGWNGAAVLFKDVEGRTIGSASFSSGNYAEVGVVIPTGTIILEWQAGSSDYECSFDILYSNGDVMISYDSAPYGIFYSWTNTCVPPTCLRPTDVAVAEITDNQATITWVDNSDAASWEIEYGHKGFAHGEGTIVEVNSNPAVLAGLESGTYYDVYVRAKCSADDVSDWSYLVCSFFTQVVCGEGTVAIDAVIGNGTIESSTLPANANYCYTYVQELYTAEELAAQGAFVGEINTLAFQHYGPEVTGVNLKVLMSNVDMEDLTGGWYINENNMEFVYEGDFTLEQGDGDYNVELLLTNPFFYDGTSDILVTFIYARTPYVDGTKRFYTHATNTTMAVICQNDTAPYGFYNPTSGIPLSERNNLKFGMCITEPEYITISGQVTSTLNNTPVANAIVQFQGTLGATLTTDANGEYSVNLLQEFNYNVIITATGFNTYNETITTPVSEAATFDFAINQPVISVNPEEIETECYSMQSTTEEIVITNHGTGELTWRATSNIDDGRKGVESVAHVAFVTDVYNMTLNNPEGATPAGFSHTEFLNSTVFVDGITYYVSNASGMFGIIDYEAKTIETIASGLGVGNITYNPVNGQLIVMSLGEGVVFYTLDPITAEKTQIVASANNNFVVGGAMSNTGRMFVINGDIGDYIGGISEVDLTTGEYTTIWNCGFNVNFGQDLEWDYEDNLLYWAAWNHTANAAQLYSIDVDAGEGTFIGTFAAQTSALTIETYAGKTPWMSVEPKSGTVAPNSSSTLTVTLDGWYADEGTFTGSVEINNNTIEDLAIVPVTFTINPPTCDPVTNPAIEVVDFNDIVITWEAPENADGVIAYGIYAGEDNVSFAEVDASTFEFVIEDQPLGSYAFRVRAIYEDGCISLSDVLLQCTTSEPMGTVFGTITDSYSGDAIAGATITIGEQYTLTTDENGAYSIELVVGIYEDVIISADTYYTLTIESITVEMYDNPMDFELVNKYQPIQNLAAELVGSTAELTWEAPAGEGSSSFNIVLYENFNSATTPAAWTKIDSDGDGHNWGTETEVNLDTNPYEGEGCVASASFTNATGPLTPDNWLISPAIAINGGTITYYVCAQDAQYSAEHYGVFYSVNGTDPSSFQLLFEETLTSKSKGAIASENISTRSGAKAQGTWYERTVALDAINAAEVHIAFRHFNVTNQYFIVLDEVTVESKTPAVVPTSFIIERDGAELATVEADVLSYIDETIESESVYTYCVTAIYDDTNSVPVCVEFETGVLGIADNNTMAAYPNPFSTSVTVENNANAEFVVTSITGQVVYRETTSTNFVWTPSNVSGGVYFINIFVDGVNVQTEKVVYQK